MKKLVVFSLNIKQNKQILTQLLYLKEAQNSYHKDETGDYKTLVGSIKDVNNFFLQSFIGRRLNI